IGAFPWRLVDGESCICRILAFVDDDRHAALMAKKERSVRTKWNDVAGSPNAWLHEEARKKG
ncbi:MAG TPA: cyclase family protein, partial [Thermoanaerobaculia bacterium]|nr:cyclase family protein [Thermoanaerobaculia bacterium]